VTDPFPTLRPAVYGVNSTLEFNYWMGNYSVLFLLAHDGEIVNSWQVSLTIILSYSPPSMYWFVECIYISGRTKENQPKVPLHHKW